MHHVTILKTVFYTYLWCFVIYLFVSFYNTFRLTVKKFVLIVDWNANHFHNNS